MKRRTLPVIFIVILIAATGGLFLYRQRTRIDMDQKVSFPSIRDIPKETWEILTQKKTFFAHMSVGYNILSGTRRKEKEVSFFSYSILEAEREAEFDAPALYHRQLGHNGDAIAKINAFREMMLAMKLSPPDLALMKLCYVDIDADTNTENLFSEYQRMIYDLKRELPNTRLLHCTAPLTSSPLSAKEKVKEIIRPLLGKITEAGRNEKRNQYNQLLYKSFEEDTIFDIAKIESTSPQGHPYLHKGSTPMLFADYTTDGGHLNEVGQDRLGEQFLIFLAKNAK